MKDKMLLAKLLLLLSYNIPFNYGFSIVCNKPVSRTFSKKNVLPSKTLLRMNIGYLSDFYDYYENKDDDQQVPSNMEQGDALEEEMFDTVEDYGEELKDHEETIVLHPVPESPNEKVGSKYVAIFFDADIDNDELRTEDERFNHRKSFATIKSHVRWAREANLVNSTFFGPDNAENKNCDIPFSYTILDTTHTKEIGNIICFNAVTAEDALAYLAKEPIVRYLMKDAKNEESIIDELKDKKVLYKWRHVKEAKLRQDDGRFGLPTAMIGLDDIKAPSSSLESRKIRAEHAKSHYEYLIRSERVIAAGPLLPYDFNHDDDDDKGNSMEIHAGIGDLVFFNSKSLRDGALFAEEDPLSLQGLYESLQVCRYNTIDISGKHVALDKFSTENDDVVFNEMEEEGYPVYDYQTPWIR